MAVSLYFGLPGCGKTTMLTKLAYDAALRGSYPNIYTNVGLNIPGVTLIDNTCIGKYELRDCLLLIDEATLFADSRDHKNFTKKQISYFLEHRHRCADIVLFTQQWDGVDKKIRVITDRVYYMYKGILTGEWISSCVRIPYGIAFPDPKKGGDKLGEIIQGYSKPPLLVRMLARRIYRPNYYPYFDSWELVPFESLPSSYTPVPGNIHEKHWFRHYLHKTFILLRSWKTMKRSQKKAFRRSEPASPVSSSYSESSFSSVVVSFPRVSVGLKK